MSQPHVFISYARDDEKTARLFAAGFQREGFAVWWDDALHSGDTFDEVIETQLRAAKAVIVLWSPRSVASRWVRAEATLADRNKTLAPVIIEPCNRPIIFELTHTADLSHWSGDISDPAWQSFVKDVRRLVSSAPANPQTNQIAETDKPPEGRPILFGDTTPSTGSAPSSSMSDLLARGQVDSLISALSTLQQSMGKNAGGQVSTDLEETETTQFYTKGDPFDLSEEVHCLELSREGEEPKRVVIGPVGLKIGRSAPADLILPDAKVSRSHCMVELKDNELFVSDLNSTNGTYVDGQRVAAASVLPVGAVLTVGQHALVHSICTRAEV